MTHTFTEVKIEWGQDPPPRRGTKNIDWYKIASELKARPGEWAFLGRLPAGSAGAIKNGQLMAFKPARSFDAMSRGYQANTEQNVGPTAETWAMYVGVTDR
jgi:hypothetical protein